MARAQASSEPSQDAQAAAPSRARRARRFVLEVGFVLLAFFLITRWQTRSLLTGGQPAPDFALRDLEGHTVRLSDFGGKTVLVHFWATWCGVCQREFGMLNSLYDHLDQNEALLTIVDSSSEGDIEAFAREHGLKYPVLLGTPAVRDAYRVQAFPTNYFVGADGTLEDATVGMSTRLAMSARMHCAR